MSEPAAPAAAPNGSATPNNGLPPRFGAAPKAPAPSPAEQKAAAAEKEAAARQYVVDDIASQIAKSGFDPSKSVAENKHQAETPDVAKPDGKAATVKIGDVEIEPERFREIMARQAELDLAAAKRPADPSALQGRAAEGFCAPGRDAG